MKLITSSFSLRLRLPRLGFAALLLLLVMGHSPCHAQTISSVNPNSTTAGQNITMIIGGSGTNFLAATGCYLQHSTTGTLYYGTAFIANSPTNATVNFTLPPNASFGFYTLSGYNNFTTLNNALNVAPGPGSPYGFVSGKVIVDNNSNCIENVGIDNPDQGTVVTDRKSVV